MLEKIWVDSGNKDQIEILFSDSEFDNDNCVVEDESEKDMACYICHQERSQRLQSRFLTPNRNFSLLNIVFFSKMANFGLHWGKKKCT